VAEDDYGAKHKDLHFHKDGGEVTLGLRYENEHRVQKDEDGNVTKSMCNKSIAKLDFLLAILDSLLTSFPKEKLEMMDYMRVKVIHGAETQEHTDTMRGVTPNFMLIEPGSNFSMQIREFPAFRSSVVKLDGQLYIPHELKCDRLVLIGLDESGLPHYYKFEPKVIDKLQPYGELHTVVVGIKGKKLQVVPPDFAGDVIERTKELPLKTIDEIFLEASHNPQKKPPKIKRPITNIRGNKEYIKWHKFYGWKYAHRLEPLREFTKKRIHVFFRLIREETSSARIRTTKKGQPINYTIVNNELK